MSQGIATQQDKLGRDSVDCSRLLTHLIREDEDRDSSAAHGILRSILGLVGSKTPQLRAGKQGWYASPSCSNARVWSPEREELVRLDVEPSVCLTESTLAGLKAHRDVFAARYGVAFDRAWLCDRGANPAINLSEDLLKAPVTFQGKEKSVFNFIPKDLRPYVNIAHAGFDARHEREWRHVGHLDFNYEDLFFLFCPESDFAEFSRVQNNGKPVLFDLSWLDRV